MPGTTAPAPTAARNATAPAVPAPRTAAEVVSPAPDRTGTPDWGYPLVGYAVSHHPDLRRRD